MPARKTTTRKNAGRPNGPVLYLHAKGTQAIDRPWLERIHALGLRVFSHASLPGTQQTQNNLERIVPLLNELQAEAPGQTIVLIRAGLRPTAEQLAELQALLSAPEGPRALTVMSNAAPECNPFAGLTGPEPPNWSDLSTAVRLMAEPALHKQCAWPDHLLALSPAAAGEFAHSRAEPADFTASVSDSLELAEWLFVPDERSAVFSSTKLEPHESKRPAAWGSLSEHLQGWLDAGAPAVKVPGANSQPVTLHITHSWGGGVSLWTQAFIDADEASDHLQLRSEQAQTGGGNGQRLALYAGNELRFPIASWWLQPPIASIEIENGQYQQALQEVLARFGVGRVLVSSLVGHSLDALRTGLPTLQVLHDYFPLWPLLSVHPHDYAGKDGIDLPAAIRSQQGKMEFGDRDADQWYVLRDACYEAITRHPVKLVAPSQSVIDLYRQLDSRWDGVDIALVPHGLPPLLRTQPVAARPRPDQKLRLLIPGRIQPGKGKALLKDALPGLAEHAHIYLLGTGKHGEDFFGLQGVSVVLQYRREELPDLLREIGPHLAALLSIVPETYSYMLSELQRLGLPVIATRRGSFEERIEHGVTGWLIEPSSKELIETVARIASKPELLRSISEAILSLPSNDMADMVRAYEQLCPAELGAASPPGQHHSLAQAQAESARYLVAQGGTQLRQARVRQREIERELGRRSQWAEQAKQNARERQEWAERANQDAEKAKQRATELEADLAERLRWAEAANTAAEEAREHVAELEQTVAERTRWAEAANTAAEEAREHVAELEQTVAERTRWAEAANTAAEQARKHAAELEQTVAERTAWAQALDKTLREERESLGAEISSLGKALAENRSELATTRSELRELAQLHESTEAERRRLQELQDLILASFSWRVTRPLRVLKRSARTLWQARIYNPLRWPLLASKGVRYLATRGVGGTIERLQAPAQSAVAPETAPRKPDLAPERSGGDKPARRGPDHSGSTTTGAAKRDAEPGAIATALTTPSPERPLSLVCPDEPQISIVIPAYNQWAYTRQCLESIAATRCETSFEVIVVDDASADETETAMTALAGVRYLRNKQNLGFIGSCNRGAKQARGAFLVLLNNDTQVSDGWLDRLVETFNEVPDAGLVGAKLVYPDGTLQECGGMVFSDGSGWNYGRHDDPDRPEYQYLRETDYCSGACIMLRTATFSELGGFDSHYAPAYYEDTDLAFRIREAGLKVLVQPAAVVIHHEGITSGTDTASGTKRYQEVNRDKFLERWADSLAQQAPPINDPDNLAQVRQSRDHHLQGRVLVIDATTPEPDQDSGSVRLTNLMQCFRGLGYGVTFFADNRMHAGRYTRQLQRDGVEVLYLPWLDPLKAFFEERGSEFDYVFISRHYIAVNYLSLLKRYCPRAPFIFDTVDLHYLREQRLAELEDSTALRQVAKQTRRSELGIVAAADVTVVVSPVEVEVLAKDAPGSRVHVLSNIHEVPGCRTGFNERKDLFFVGGYQHPPNIDAATWFVRDIWPLVRQRLPDVQFHLIGSKATDEIRALDGNGVVFHGFVEELEPWLDRCRLAVAPLRYGAGVKGKVNMSMSYGQPVVATPIAVEGMFAEDGREVLVAETAETFAEQIVRLYQDETLWNRVSAAAVENVKAHFSIEAARASLENLLDTLPEKPRD